MIRCPRQLFIQYREVIRSYLLYFLNFVKFGTMTDAADSVHPESEEAGPPRPTAQELDDEEAGPVLPPPGKKRKVGFRV
jgi:hypothetical protein